MAIFSVMLTDLIAQFILLFTRLLALLFIVKAVGQLVRSPLLERVLRPFASWMDPLLERVRNRFTGTKPGFDWSPILVAVAILVTGSFLAWIF
ncbi:MAG TPA: hypothetical protein VLM37_09815 [Fibrobacteraceae bacterium]|nr:hypothetical protein [Fibrobacteraceae bacterium]